MRKLLTISVLTIIMLSLSSCIFIPFIDGYKQIGVTESDRKTLFDKTNKAFYNLILSGRYNNISDYLHPDYKDELVAGYRKERKEEKVVESSVDIVDFYEHANTAIVEMKIKAYRIPYYILEERYEKQKWEFLGVRSKWRLVSREIIE